MPRGKKVRFFFQTPVQCEPRKISRTLVTTSYVVREGYVEFRDTETELRVPLANIDYWIKEPESQGGPNDQQAPSQEPV